MMCSRQKQNVNGLPCPLPQGNNCFNECIVQHSQRPSPQHLQYDAIWAARMALSYQIFRFLLHSWNGRNSGYGFTGRACTQSVQRGKSSIFHKWRVRCVEIYLNPSSAVSEGSTVVEREPLVLLPSSSLLEGPSVSMSPAPTASSWNC